MFALNRTQLVPNEKPGQYIIIYLIISTEYCLIFKICTLSLVNSYDRWIVCNTQWRKVHIFVQIAHCCGLHIITVKCCAKHLAYVGERGGREKGVTRIQFITSEAAGTQPPVVQIVQNVCVQTICAFNISLQIGVWQRHNLPNTPGLLYKMHLCKLATLF